MLLKQKTLTALLIASAVASTAFADDSLKDSKFVADSSYALGVLMAKNVAHASEMQKEFIQYDNAQILAGFKDSLDGKAKLTDEQLGTQLRSLDEKLKAEVQKKEAEIANEFAKAGDEFRKAYAAKKGVKSTKSGLLYRIENAGSGESAVAADTVKVHYKGTFTNGDVFDSSYDRGEPIEFPLAQLIPGWIEGIPLIKKGGKIELVLPPELAYGKNGSGNIPPNATLVFEIELLDVIKAKKDEKK